MGGPAVAAHAGRVYHRQMDQTTGKKLSLRLRLLSGLLILVFVALFTVAVTVYIGFSLVLPAELLGVAVAVVIVADMFLVYLIADQQLSRYVLKPVDEMVGGAERVATGEQSHRLVGSDTIELDRLAAAVNIMAGTLIHNQDELADNVASLDATNRALSDARQRLVRAEKLASIGRLAAGVAHEVGNPLGAIFGYTAIGRKGSTDVPEWLGGIDYEAKRIDRIVRGLLDFARPKAASPREMDLNDVVNRTVQMMTLQGRFRNVAVEMDLADDLPLVRADSHQLEQVLINLLLNAADAIGESGSRGTVELATRFVEVEKDAQDERRRRVSDPEGIDYSHLRRFESASDPGPQRSLARGDAAVELLVTDDGPGIPPNVGGRVFEPFFTTKEPGKGTGLGLAVSARLIEGMGGTIDVTAAEAGGARFRLLLPADSQREPTSA
jgi:signal transduction histidine kinase